MWPKWLLIKNIKISKNISLLNVLSAFSKSRTKAESRIGPHNMDVLSVLICGMLGDWWGDIIKISNGYSVRYNIEQSISNSAYIHHLTNLFFNWGYCSYIIPKFIKKNESLFDKRLVKSIDRYNYRLSLFTFSSLNWIYDSFYCEIEGKNIKKNTYLNWRIYNTYWIGSLNYARWFTTKKARYKHSN